MPPPLAVDREAVRVLVVAVGVREAARQTGISENTVLAWANRGKWLQSVADARAISAARVAEKSATPSKTASTSLQSPAIKPADALANVLADDSKQTRIGFSRAYRRAAEHVQEQTGAQIAEQAQDIKALVQGAALVHGWEAGAAKPTHVQINLLGGAYGEKQAQVTEKEQDTPVIDV